MNETADALRNENAVKLIGAIQEMSNSLPKNSLQRRPTQMNKIKRIPEADSQRGYDHPPTPV